MQEQQKIASEGEVYNSSVSRALDIIETILKLGKPMTISDISRALSLNRTTCTNLVKTLIAKKFLYKNYSGKIYLTGKIYVMGKIYKDSLPIVDLFGAICSDVCNKYHCACHLIGFSGLSQAIVLSRLPDQAIYYTSKLNVYPLYCTGGGKVLLAHQNRETIKSLLSQIELKPMTENTITESEDLVDELKKIKKQGFGFDNAEFIPHLYCVSAPIYNQEGNVELAVSLSMENNNADVDLTPFVPVVLDLANKLSYLSGYRDTKNAYFFI